MLLVSFLGTALSAREMDREREREKKRERERDKEMGARKREEKSHKTRRLESSRGAWLPMQILTGTIQSMQGLDIFMAAPRSGLAWTEDRSSPHLFAHWL